MKKDIFFCFIVGRAVQVEFEELQGRGGGVGGDLCRFIYIRNVVEIDE